jgi:hypothetical protein
MDLLKLYEQIRADAHPKEMDIDGRKYTTRPISEVRDPMPEPLKVSTLTGLADYLNKNPDGLDIDTLICHVRDEKEICVNSKLVGAFHQRICYAKAVSLTKQPPFGAFIDVEKFNIILQSCFVDCEKTDRAEILRIVGNVKEKLVMALGDDGISQKVTAKTGVALVDDVKIKNPAILRPYRTFNDVDQPASKFVLRGRTGPEFGLFEADNGAWVSEAMQNIKAYMEEKVPGLHIIA